MRRVAIASRSGKWWSPMEEPDNSSKRQAHGFRIPSRSGNKAIGMGVPCSPIKGQDVASEEATPRPDLRRQKCLEFAENLLGKVWSGGGSNRAESLTSFILLLKIYERQLSGSALTKKEAKAIVGADERATLKRYVDMVISHRLVVQRPSPKDARYKVLRLTQKGVDLVEEELDQIRKSADKLLPSKHGRARKKWQSIQSG